MKPENAFASESLPCNAIPFINRIYEILRENKTNSFESLPETERQKIESCLWIINTLFYGQLFKLDSFDIFCRLSENNNNK